jgi:anti-sigma regulatory factor (Ser/Thr protein kinase)
MSYVTCPNCGVTLAGTSMVEPPTTCPDCCAHLRADVALSPPPPARGNGSGSLDAVLLSGRDAPWQARREFESFGARLRPDVAATGTLLVSEMVSNAVIHGPAAPASEIALHCDIVGRTLHVEVADDGSGFVPSARAPDEGAGGRWGLRLVETLAATWGVDRGRPTRVWFELPL